LRNLKKNLIFQHHLILQQKKTTRNSKNLYEILYFERPDNTAPTAVIEKAQSRIIKFFFPLISLYTTIPKRDATIGGPEAPNSIL
jgi:hypothetical protein